MQKSLYSLMLMDDVVREIDRLAAAQGMSRSGLVNSVLAEYASMTTPEKRIGEIYKQMELLIGSAGGLTPFLTPNRTTMYLKSSLDYKYRPTIKYEVELFRTPHGDIGELAVVFRTQSAELLRAVESFFSLWKRLEDVYAAPRMNGRHARYALYDGKLVRSISLPEDGNTSNESISGAISAYITMLDELMKGYLSGKYDARELESGYLKYLAAGTGLI